MGLATALLCPLAPVQAGGGGEPPPIACEADRSVPGTSVSVNTPQTLPANLLYVRISQRFLAQHADTVVERQELVSDRILGSDIRGRAQISGMARFLLEASADSVVINAVFSGTIDSRTSGYKGPVTIERQSHTPVRASRQIVLDGDGIRLSPTTATARTTSKTTGIRTKSGGLRGRITERIAWGRTNKTQEQADAIASQRAAARTRTSFDQEVQKVVATLQQTLGGLAKLSIAGESQPLAVGFHSTPDYMEIVAGRPHAGPDARDVQPPPVEGDPSIAVRAHRSVVLQLLAAGNLKEMLPVLPTQQRYFPEGGTPGGAPYRLVWSPDRNWLTLSTSATASRSPAPAREVKAISQ